MPTDFTGFFRLPPPHSYLGATHCLAIWLPGGLCAPDLDPPWGLPGFSKLRTGRFSARSPSSEPPPLPRLSGDLRETPRAVPPLQSYDLNQHGCSEEANSKPRVWWEPPEPPSLQLLCEEEWEWGQLGSCTLSHPWSPARKKLTAFLLTPPTLKTGRLQIIQSLFTYLLVT